MRIAIYSNAKDGSSALFSKLNEAMPQSTVAFFEPGPLSDRKVRLYRWLSVLGWWRKRPLLVKFLPLSPNGDRHLASFGAFDHEILILRDPRDRLISALLYHAYASPLADNRDHAEEYIELLVAKERDPTAVPLTLLIETFERLCGRDPVSATQPASRFLTFANRALTFAALRPDAIEFRYEDLIDQNYAALGQALGLELAGRAKVARQYQRVERSFGSGDWRRWFTPADIAVFEPAYRPYLARYFPETDWALDPKPAIQCVHASGYARRVIDEWRAHTGRPPFWSGSEYG